MRVKNVAWSSHIFLTIINTHCIRTNIVLSVDIALFMVGKSNVVFIK